MHESNETISLSRTTNLGDQNEITSVGSYHIDDDEVVDNSDSNHRNSLFQSIISTSSSETDFLLYGDDEDMYDINIHGIYTMNLEEYLMGKQFSKEKVEHRIASLAKYKV